VRQQDQPWRVLVVIELGQEGLKDFGRFRPGPGARIEIAVAPALVGADEKNLDAGLPAFQATTWTPWSATLGTPLPIRQFLYEQIALSLRKPEVRDRLIQLGNTIPDGMTPEATRAFIAAELEKWVPIVRATGARVD
jgi:hypothetical protein